MAAQKNWLANTHALTILSYIVRFYRLCCIRDKFKMALKHLFEIKNLISTYLFNTSLTHLIFETRQCDHEMWIILQPKAAACSLSCSILIYKCVWRGNLTWSGTRRRSMFWNYINIAGRANELTYSVDSTYPPLPDDTSIKPIPYAGIDTILLSFILLKFAKNE